jgi:hypothetical protein
MEENQRDDVYSKSVRAGKRTYFFDVKTTRGNDLYMTITESKRKTDHDGQFVYDKHKIFLYKEDFEKFIEGLEETVEKIKELKATGNYPDDGPLDRKKESEGNGTNFGFDDL